MGIRRFNDSNGRLAWVLTHVDAVIGLDGRSLSQILGDMQEEIEEAAASGGIEDGSDKEIWDMEVGKLYKKDGKIYICTISGHGDNLSDYEVVSIGSDGIKISGRKEQLPTHTYTETIATLSDVCVVDDEMWSASPNEITLKYGDRNNVPYIVKSQDNIIITGIHRGTSYIQWLLNSENQTFKIRIGAVTDNGWEDTIYPNIDPLGVSEDSAWSGGVIKRKLDNLNASIGSKADSAYVQSQFSGLSTWIHQTFAPLGSPALTGTPTAPTAAAGTNTTQIATTEFVQTATADFKPVVVLTQAEFDALTNPDSNTLYMILENTASSGT